MTARFVFAATQAGAERSLKNEIAREHPELRFAFSRPGFVTFRVPEETDDRFRLRSVFARTWGISLGKVEAADDALLVRATWQRVAERLLGDASTELRHLHVWQRDRALPGDEGYDAASAELERAIGAALLEQRPRPGPALQPAVNVAAAEGEPVLDCVLVERHEWWLGWHRASSPETRWPGGVPPIALPERLVSRAYLKIVEALEWSDLPIAAGDKCVEIGSSPGGSCLALLERGLVVTGIDPAEMDAAVLAHPSFTHLRARAKDVKRSVFRDCRWLVMDANVAPNYTLDTLDGLLMQAGVRPEGLVLTLKLTDSKLAEKLPEIAERIRGHGYRRVRMRQLAFNRQEVCAVATDPVPRPERDSL
ncbi:MAG TPA: SAM-dependent methyltransferase [Gammaproteobacteria bacterium]|nr:SAM-dependent methyltransferase [Gammaproteobacteria bacterium]